VRLLRLAGEIERRLLVNFRLDPSVIASMLPAPFRRQIVDRYSVAGICLIRLGAMRPLGLPAWTGPAVTSSTRSVTGTAEHLTPFQANTPLSSPPHLPASPKNSPPRRAAR
jgi:hypothetical protein